MLSNNQMETIADLVADLDRNRDKYCATGKRVKTKFEEKLRHTPYLWQSRVKTPASLEQKLTDRSSKYDNEAANVADVRDLVGIRIILAFYNDVRQIEKFVKKTFKVVHQTQHPKDDINIVDSGKRFRGYNALHLYVTLHSRSDEQYWNPVVEIQVMTGFMWVYATLHHDVVYKKLSGEPTEESLKKIDMIRGAANVGELALEMYNNGFLTPDVNSELKSRVESAVDLDARSQSVLQLTNPRHDRHRAKPSIVPGFEDAAEERAYALIRNETRNKAAHLEGVAEARQILLQGIATFTNDGSSSIRHLRMLRYLAVAERKLSLEEGLDTGKNMELLNQAERHIEMAVGLDTTSGLVGAREQMTLERHIVRGLRAKLQFRMPGTPGKSLAVTRWLLSVASAGIEKALEDLEKVDVVKYEKIKKFGLEWIDYFRRFDARS